MAKGDHLIVQYGAYTHHGIDLGDGTVIHYGRGLHNKANARVEIVSWEIFAGDCPITICDDKSVNDPDEVVTRAMSRLGECDYDLVDNNCEHFATWCRTGVSNSGQVNLVDAICRRGSAAAAKLVFPGLVKRFVAARYAGRIASPLALPAGLAGDAVQLSAEVLAIRAGKDQDATKNIGRRSGALASSGIGYMLGGPAGAAVGFGNWLFGEALGQNTTPVGRWRGTQDNTSSEVASR